MYRFLEDGKMKTTLKISYPLTFSATVTLKLDGTIDLERKEHVRYMTSVAAFFKSFFQK